MTTNPEARNPVLVWELELNLKGIVRDGFLRDHFQLELIEFVLFDKGGETWWSLKIKVLVNLHSVHLDFIYLLMIEKNHIFQFKHTNCLNLEE